MFIIRNFFFHCCCWGYREDESERSILNSTFLLCTKGCLLRGAASWHRTYEDAGTFLGFAFTKSGIRCRAASDAGLRPKNAGILICAMQRSSDAGAASRHHPAYINHEYQQKNWKIKKKSWKICKKKVENAFLRFSKCKSCIRCIFCI